MTNTSTLDRLRRAARNPRVRRVASLPVGTVAVALVWVLMVNGTLAYGVRATHIIAIAMLALAAALRALPLPERGPGAKPGALLRSEFATLPLAAIWLTSSAFGADAQLVFPLGLIVLAGGAALLGREASVITAATAVALAVAQWIGFGSWRGDARELAAEVFYILGLTAAGWWLIRPSLQRAASMGAREAREQGDAEAMGVTDAALAERPLSEASVDSRLETLGRLAERLLRLGRAAVDGHTAAFLVRHNDDAFHVFKTVGKDTELIVDGPIAADSGPLAALLRAQSEPGGPPALRMEVKPDGPGLPYYSHTPARVRWAMWVPLRGADGAVDALLAIDRTTGDAFDDEAVARAVELSATMARAFDLERDAAGAASRIAAQEEILEVVRALAVVHDPAETFGAVLSGAERLVDLRLGLLCTIDGQDSQVAAAVGPDALPLVGAHIPESGSMAALALRTNTTIPTNRTWTAANGPLIAPHLGPKLAEGEPLLAVPLRYRDRHVGAMLLVATEPFDDETCARLKILATQAAVALHQSRAVSDLQRRATIDALTGIDNRAALLGRLDQSIKRLGRLGLPMAVVQIDIDHFKAVNDTYGHPAGDEVLKAVASVLRARKRDSDAVGRMGGEEFVMVLEQADEPGAVLVCERLRRAIQDVKVATSKGVIQVTASFGVALAPDHGERAEDLLSRADAALYRAKEGGRNQVRLFKKAASTSRAPLDTVEDPRPPTDRDEERHNERDD